MLYKYYFFSNLDLKSKKLFCIISFYINLNELTVNIIKNIFSCLEIFFSKFNECKPGLEYLPY